MQRNESKAYLFIAADRQEYTTITFSGFYQIFRGFLGNVESQDIII
jgi:hypothetical protein